VATAQCQNGIEASQPRWVLPSLDVSYAAVVSVAVAASAVVASVASVAVVSVAYVAVAASANSAVRDNPLNSGYPSSQDRLSEAVLVAHLQGTPILRSPPQPPEQLLQQSSE
jgi:hypothetical protein